MPGWFACLAVVVVVILGYFLFKFLCSHKCSRWQVDRRRAQRESDMTSKDKKKDTKVPPALIDTGKCMQVSTLPPSYEQCMKSQIYLVKMEQPPSYMEYEA
ncbi:hypothetical protein KP79_PYT03218 [Mizuhopecten yessoensis]|uniref:Uncharacterized protein n=1 Tax=Mizuhopecten yessoensis TaxID=6573 RepID=A0A210PIK4_MIZYE|nr:hypothetical protein KP79_PYT03218 [Mizuhopecten yessoensis]